MMRIAVTGSIAVDHLMAFPARFVDQLVPAELSRISLSLLVEDLEVRRGGVAANISFGLGSLGTSPVLVGAVGRDFDEYAIWLRENGVNTSGVLVSQNRHTARFLCTTDVEQNQIATFYVGAMREARNIELAVVAERTGRIDLVLIAPNDPEAMLRHTAECRARQYRFAADPSQQLPRMARDQARSLVTGAAFLFTNQYESALLSERTSWSRAEILGQAGMWITTLGAEGVRIDRCDQETTRVPAVEPRSIVDPTGAGDGFRAGFLYGVGVGLSAERSAQLGCLVATTVLEAVGAQQYALNRAELSKRAAQAYGAQAAGEIESVLRTRC